MGKERGGRGVSDPLSLSLSLSVTYQRLGRMGESSQPAENLVVNMTYCRYYYYYYYYYYNHNNNNNNNRFGLPSSTVTSSGKNWPVPLLASVRDVHRQRCYVPMPQT